jgi:hypothetical protein
MRKYLRATIAVASLSAALLATSSSAMAAAPTGDYAKFKYCPYSNTAVIYCLNSQTTSGSFKIGNATVPITSSTPLTLQGGIGLIDPSTGMNAWYDAVGADSLVKVPLKVPGGLIGLVDTGGFTGALISLFNAAVASVNDVYATAEQAGPISFSLTNAIGSTGTAAKLPIRVHLTNPFLGSSCYIGSTSHPISLNLTTGTTAPPAPNTPISGSPGTPVSSGGGTLLTLNGVKLVDNSFSAPAASNCGFLLLDKLLITAAVNLKEGLPSAAGNNSATLGGTTYLGLRSAVLGSVQ